jgi:hypothetical protein
MIQPNPLSARQSSRAAQWCLHNSAMRSVYCSQYRQHVVSVSGDWRWMVMDYVLDQSILLLSWGLSVDLYSSIMANLCNRDASDKNIEQSIGSFFLWLF